MRGPDYADDAIFNFAPNEEAMFESISNDGDAGSDGNYQTDSALERPSRVRTNFVETWMWTEARLGYNYCDVSYS